jgi:hypothetical protein
MSYKYGTDIVATKGNCGVCYNKKYLFTFIKDGNDILACSDCATELMLTGWSR